jgi:hypothetical protein
MTNAFFMGTSFWVGVLLGLDRISEGSSGSPPALPSQLPTSPEEPLMRVRLVLGGLAAALALGSVAPAQASPSVDCSPLVSVVCQVICRVSHPLCLA